MAGATEIYICRPGQTLKEGKLEYSHDVTTRAEAESDAIRRCDLDAGIGRIAYYAVNESGKFRCFYTFDNPKMDAARRMRGGDLEEPTRRPDARPPRERTLGERIRAFFEA